MLVFYYFVIRLDVIPGVKDKDKRKSLRLICRCCRDVLNLSHQWQQQTIILKAIRLICTLLFAGQQMLDEVQRYLNFTSNTRRAWKDVANQKYVFVRRGNGHIRNLCRLCLCPLSFSLSFSFSPRTYFGLKKS